MRRILTILFLLTWLFFGIRSDAGARPAPEGPAQPELSFSRISLDEGLSNSSVMSVLQDYEGFIWVGTQEGGLNRYDGHDFTVYKHDPLTLDSLRHNFVWTLYEDRENTLWVGTLGGLNRYDREQDRLLNVPLDLGEGARVSGLAVRAIFEASDGSFWIGANSLSRLDRATGRLTVYRHDPDDPTSISNNNVQGIVEDRLTGDLWLATAEGGVNVFHRDTETFTRYMFDPDDPNSVSSNDIFHIYQDSAGDLWFSSLRGGLNRFDRETGTFIRYEHDPNNPASISSNAVWSTFEDSSGRFWVGTSTGLDLLDRATGRFTIYRHDPEDPTSLSSEGIRVVYEDEARNLWVGTTDSGLSFLSAVPPKFTNYRQALVNSNSLNGNVIRAICAEDSDNIWISTVDGLNLYQPHKRQFTRYEHDPDDPGSVSRYPIQTIECGSEAGLWLGTAGGGLNFFDGETFTHYVNNPQDRDSIASDYVRGLALDADGGLWLSVFGSGLDYFDGERFRHFVPTFDGFEILYLTHLLQDREQDVLWIASEEHGLLQFDQRDERFERFAPSRGDTTRASLDRINMIHQDASGALWLATFSGLVRFDTMTGQFTDIYTMADGLPDDVITGIVEDTQGQLWLSTLNGMSQFNPQSGVFRNYDTADGLISNGFNRAVIDSSPDGRIFVGSVQGMTAFQPAQLQANPYIPPVVLTGFELFNQPVAIGAEGSPLTASISMLDRLTLMPDQNVFTLKFAALNYTVSANNTYAYMLEGFDDDWRYTSADRRFATYTNLDPGDYVFRVIGSNNDSVWNREGVALPITVIPSWWQTWWARALLGLTIFAAVGGVIFNRTYRVSLHNRQLQAQLLERNRMNAEKEKLLVAVQEQSQRVQSIMDTIPEGVVFLDAQYRVLSANPTAEESLALLSGVSVGEVITEVGSKHIDALLAAPPQGLWHEVTSEDETGRRYFAVVARAVGGSTSQYWVLLLRETTAERTLQEKLSTQQRLASIGQFAAGIAHDFNNMLSVAVLNAEMLQRYADLDTRFQEKAQRIISQAITGKHLIQQILDYSRQAVTEFRALDLAVVLKSQIKMVAQILPDNIHLAFDPDPEAYTVLGDPTRLQQVLINLVVNARDAMPDGGRIDIGICTIDVRETDKPFELLTPGCWVMLTVQDSGVGIPEDILPRIFEPFFTTKPLGEGTGLGLAQIYGIVKQHNGYIDVQTQVGAGTTFTIYLPGYDISDSDVLDFGRDTPYEILRGYGETILVVEDKAPLRESLTDCLRSINYEVVTAQNGEDALAIWQDQPIDLILTDIMMPKLGGIGLIQRLRERGESLPIVIMTGYMAEPDNELSLEAFRQKGPVELLTKPIDLVTLSKVIARVLSKE